MQKTTESDYASIAAALRVGGLVVLRTDTIYGVVASANNQKACEKVYALKGRDGDKACIVLVAGESHMWDDISRRAYAQALPRLDDQYPTSVIVSIGAQTPAWIHRGKDSVAFRIPSTKPWLIELLKQTGPLIAPSANPQGLEPAKDIGEAIDYFGEAVAVYVDGGAVESNEPSHLYRVDGENVERLR